MEAATEPVRGDAGAGAPTSLTAWWLGRTAYRDAWALQHRLVEARVAGEIGDQLLLLEHEPVLTLGRHSDDRHIRAAKAELAARGIDVVRVERGGEVTYHGPGQLVSYPILALRERGLLVRPFVRALEAALIETCAAFGIPAVRRDGSPGCWIEPLGDGSPRKVGALGVRIERGVSYHGVALNVAVDLRDFELIDACGMPGVESTSIDRLVHLRGEALPAYPVSAAAAAFGPALAAALGASLFGELPPIADPTAARRALEAMLLAAERRAAPPSAEATAAGGGRRR